MSSTCIEQRKRQREKMQRKMNRERVKNNFGEENHGESKQKDINKR